MDESREQEGRGQGGFFEKTGDVILVCGYYK